MGLRDTVNEWLKEGKDIMIEIKHKVLYVQRD